MKTIEGYSKEKYTDTSVLLAGGGAKALSDFIGTLTWDGTNKKIKYTPIGGNATDLVTLSWSNISGKPDSFTPSSHNHERILPTRHDSDAPSPKDKGKSLTFQFSYFDNDWWNVLNMRSYDDYRYLSAQLLTPAGNPGSDEGYGDMYWRQGRNSTWIAKRKICDDSNSSVSGGGDSLGSSITVKIAGTEKTLTIPSTVAWSSLTGVPSSFTPATHSHDSVHYLSPHYNSGEKPNPQEYFNESIGVKVAMTRYNKIGSDTDAWHDTLWINGYSGSDVPSMCALTFKRDGTPRFFVHSQSNRSTTYGTYYEVITEYNIASQSVNYATSAGSTTSATRTRYLTCQDTRSDAPAPGDYTASTTGVSFDFKESSVTGLGGYSGVMTVRPYASAQDWSGGPVHQIAFYSNGTLYHRTGTSSWGNWETLITSSNIGSQTVGSASYADSAGSASSATTADKVANSITFKNTAGTSVSFNGSVAKDLTSGVNYAAGAGEVKTVKTEATVFYYPTFVGTNNNSAALQNVYTNKYLKYYANSGELQGKYITLTNDGALSGGLGVRITGGNNNPINASTSATMFCIYAENSYTHSNTFIEGSAVIGAYGSGYHYDILAPNHTSKFGGLELGVESYPGPSDSTDILLAQRSSIYYVNSNKTVYLPTTYARNGRILFVINDGNNKVTFQATGKTIKYFRSNGSRTGTDSCSGERFQCIYICIYYSNTWYIAPTDVTN